MGAVFFYHLTRSGPEEAVALLAERSLAQGWPVLVRVATPARAEWLDQRLWLGPEEGFLAHGLAGGPADDLQPVLIQAAGDLPPRVRCLMALDGAEVTAAEVRALERACILFDGGDEAALARARDQWRTLTAEAVPAQYWSEKSGRWMKEAEKGV